MVRGEHLFARGELVRGSELLCPFPRNFWRTCSPNFTFAANWVSGERSLEMDVFLPANEFSGEPFASSRRSTGKLGRTLANSAELRRTFGVLRQTFAGVRRSVGVGEPMANSRGVRASSLEFARVRASSRRTTVRRVYCPTVSQKSLCKGYGLLLDRPVII